jgi:hypothetical protein
MFQTKRLAGKWASDTMDGRVKSLGGNQYAQVFSNGGFFAEVYPMARTADAGLALKSFIMEFGVPEDLTIDGSKEQNSRGAEFIKSFRKITSESPEQNQSAKIRTLLLTCKNKPITMLGRDRTSVVKRKRV